MYEDVLNLKNLVPPFRNVKTLSFNCSNVTPSKQAAL